MTNKEATRRQKVSTVKQIAKFNGCAICGYAMNTRRLHFHHLGPKTENPGDIRGLGALLNELTQCVVLCEECHKQAENGSLILADHMKISAENLTVIAEYVNFDWVPGTLENIPF